MDNPVHKNGTTVPNICAAAKGATSRRSINFDKDPAPSGLAAYWKVLASDAAKPLLDFEDQAAAAKKIEASREQLLYSLCSLPQIVEMLAGLYREMAGDLVIRRNYAWDPADSTNLFAAIGNEEEEPEANSDVVPGKKAAAKKTVDSKTLKTEARTQSITNCITIADACDALLVKQTTYYTGRKTPARRPFAREERELADLIIATIRLKDWRMMGFAEGLKPEKSVFSATIVQTKQDAITAQQDIKRFVNANLRLVIPIAVEYINRGIDFSDIIQAGNLGLAVAIEKFDWRRGNKISTLATRWIRQAIAAEFENGVDLIHVPRYVGIALVRMKRAHTKMLASDNREMTTPELAGVMGLPEKTVKEMLETPPQPSSLAEPLQPDDSDGLTVIDGVKDKDAPNAEDGTFLASLREAVKEVLGELEPREERVLRMRFGIGTGTDHTLEEVGQQFNVTRERIRQIEAKALRKIKENPVAMAKLGAYYEDLAL